MTVFGPYDQAGLDAQYDNRAKVPDAAQIVEGWLKRGAEACRFLSCTLDVPYGSDPRQAYDVFPAEGRDNPVLIFIHGGYWHSREKDIGRFLAPTFVAAGICFVSIDYRLCPAVTMEEVLGDARDAVSHIADHISDIGGSASRIHVSGHSAGGHLTAMLCGPDGLPDRLRGGCTISGLHDLEPIRLSYLNQHLGLDAASAARLSPIQVVSERGRDSRLPPLIATVGMDEGPEYLRQRDDLVAALRKAGQPALSEDVPEGNHFTALEAFGDPHHALCQAMLRQILAPGF